MKESDDGLLTCSFWTFATASGLSDLRPGYVMDGQPVYVRVRDIQPLSKGSYLAKVDLLPSCVSREPIDIVLDQEPRVARCES